MYKLITLLLVVLVFRVADANDETYITNFNSQYLDILKTADSDPQKALAELESLNPESLREHAQFHYAYSTVYSALDLPEKMLLHSDSGLEIIESQNEPWLTNFLIISRINALNRLGSAYSEITSLQSIISWAKQRQYNTLASSALLTLSSLHLSVENYSKALDNIKHSLNLAPLSGAIINHSEVNREIAAIYVYRNEFELALPYFTASYEQNKIENNVLGMSIDLFELGRAHLELNDIEMGISELNQSIDLAESINDFQGVAYAQSELASHFINQNEYEEANNLLIKSGRKFKSAGNSYMLFDNITQRCNIYIEQERFEQAEMCISNAEEVNEGGKLRYGKSNIDDLKASMYAAQDQFQKAYELLLKSQYEQEQLESKLSTEKLNDMRVLYEVEANAIKNELLAEMNEMQANTINDQSRQRTLMIILISLLALFLLLSFLFNRNLKLQSSKLHELANIDELTGLRNRSNVVKNIRKQLSENGPDKEIALVMIDLDHFKTINDSYGHALGDKVLKLFGDYCQELKVKTDLIGRLGGEEFIIAFISKTNDKGQIRTIIDELRVKTAKMSDAIAAPGLKVSISAGICYSIGKNKFRDILKHADTAMYQAKNNGRNQIISTYLN